MCVCVYVCSSGGTGERVWNFRSEEINAKKWTSGWAEKFTGKTRKGFIPEAVPFSLVPPRGGRLLSAPAARVPPALGRAAELFPLRGAD